MLIWGHDALKEKNNFQSLLLEIADEKITHNKGRLCTSQLRTNYFDFEESIDFTKKLIEMNRL